MATTQGDGWRVAWLLIVQELADELREARRTSDAANLGQLAVALETAAGIDRVHRAATAHLRRRAHLSAAPFRRSLARLTGAGLIECATDTGRTSYTLTLPTNPQVAAHDYLR